MYDESSIEIQCEGTKCTSSSNNVLLDKGKVTLYNPGTYVFGGNLNGQLNIYATEEDLFHLILRNATIESDFGPAVYANCKKLIITTEGENTIIDSDNYPEDAAGERDEDEAEDEEVEAIEEDEAEEEDEATYIPEDEETYLFEDMETDTLKRKFLKYLK